MSEPWVVVGTLHEHELADMTGIDLTGLEQVVIGRVQAVYPRAEVCIMHSFADRCWRACVRGDLTVAPGQSEPTALLERPAAEARA